jgi:broad specificity phosphatase PhoE
MPSTRAALPCLVRPQQTKTPAPSTPAEKEPLTTIRASLWARTASDRDLVPPGGGSSRQAGARLQAFLAGLPGAHGPVAVVTHGGITTELLRSLLDDDALPPQLLAAGIPPCAVTTIDTLTVVTIASTSHLS